MKDRHAFVSERRVEFRDTDAAGIMHFSVYFTCMEQAEHGLFRHVGLSVVEKRGKQTISWPRVSASCDFRGPFRFEDIIQVAASISKVGKSSLTLDFQFYNKTEGEQGAVSAGSMTTVCCELTSEGPKPVAIPGDVREKLLLFQATGEGGGSSSS